MVGTTVYSKDAFFENVHFKRSWLGLEQIAYRAMIVNISDAYAMHAKPKYALLAVSMPNTCTAAEMRALHRGFEHAAQEYGIEIIGGDTIAGSKLDITVTIISETVRPLRRRGLKPGHYVAYTGRLGRSRKELRYLLNGGTIHSGSKFVNIRLKPDFISDAVPALSCGMDISDGLFSDLQKLGDANRLGFRFQKSVAKPIGCSGEEYEMLVGFAPGHRRRLMRLAKKHRTTLTIVAEARRGRFVNRCKAHHFR